MGGGTVGVRVAVAMGGVVGMGVGVAGGLGVLVGVGVGGGEGLHPLRRGSRNNPLMTQRQRKTLVLEAILPIMIVLTSGKRFRIVRHIIAHLPQLDHFCPPALNLGIRFDNNAASG